MRQGIPFLSAETTVYLEISDRDIGEWRCGRRNEAHSAATRKNKEGNEIHSASTGKNKEGNEIHSASTGKNTEEKVSCMSTIKV